MKNKNMNAYNTIKELPNLSKEKVWLTEVDSCLLRSSIFDLENAYEKMYKEKKGFPKFKSKNRSRNSYRTNNITSMYKGKQYESIKLDLERRIIKGIEIGEKRGIMKTALSMLQEGLDLSLIRKVTGLTEAEILKSKEKYNCSN